MASDMRSTSDWYTHKLDTIFAFLILELLALTAFGLGGALGLQILQLLGFFLALFAIPFIQNHYTKEDLAPNLPWIIPLGSFCLLMGFSAFFVRVYGGWSINGFVAMAVESLGLIGFFLIGVISQFIPVLKKEYILYGLLGGLALYCVIVGFYSLIRYGFFYAALYKGLSYYYQGVLYPVSTEGKALIGFEFQEVSLRYGCVASLLLGSSGAGLFALSPKKDRRKFLILAVLAGIGVVYSAVIPYFPALIFMAIVYALAGLYCLYRKYVAPNEKRRAIGAKTVVILYFILLGVIVIGALLLLLEHRFRAFSSLCQLVFRRVPGIFQNIFLAVEDCVYNGAGDIGKVNFVSLLFGYNPGASVELHFTRFYEINLLWQNGLIAFGLFVFLVFFFLKKGREYLSKGMEDLHFRLSVAMMALSFFLYISLFADDTPVAHGYNVLMFTSQSHYMMLLFFLLGLMIEPKKRGEVHHE